MTTSSSSGGLARDWPSVYLAIFVCALVFLSQTAASRMSDDDATAFLLPHSAAVDLLRLTSSSAVALPVTVASSFLSSLFPFGAVQPAAIISFLVSPSAFMDIATQGDSEVSAEVTSWMDDKMVLSSLCSALLLTVFLIVSHDSSQPYMLPGERPELPIVKAQRVKTPRLGHRVGSKLGRKLSAVWERDSSDDSEDDDGEEEEGEEEQETLVMDASTATVTRQQCLAELDERETR